MHKSFCKGDVFDKSCLKRLVSVARKNSKGVDPGLIERAFFFSRNLHEGQVRVSKEPYFSHPLETAAILAELGLSTEVIAAGLLHDVLEDTDFTDKELKREFGREVFGLVEGVTKIDILTSESRALKKFGNLHNLLLATTRDPRVILIKLADKLHNLRTLHHMPKKDRKRIAEEALLIYVPIAHKIRIEELAVELEDLAFEHARPETFKQFEKNLRQKRVKKESELNLMVAVLRKKLKKASFYKKYGSSYSIYSKLQNTGKVLTEVNDCIILNVIMPSEAECYSALGAIHSVFPPLPNKVKDFIATPKPSLYRVLQTTVFGPKKRPVKVRIATREMDTLNRLGVVAYRKFSGKRLSKYMEHTLSKLDSILNNDRGKKVFDVLKLDFLADPVYVFTCKGKLYELPKKSTVLDFAFASEKKWALHLLRAKVNGKKAAFGKKLESGNVVEFFISKKQRAKKSWLKHVHGFTSKEILKNALGTKN